MGKKTKNKQKLTSITAKAAAAAKASMAKTTATTSSSFESQLNATKWHLPETFFHQLDCQPALEPILHSVKEGHDKLQQQFDKQKSTLFSKDCVKIETRIHGLGIFNEDFNGNMDEMKKDLRTSEMKKKLCVSDRFVNNSTNNSNIHVACIFAVETDTNSPNGTSGLPMGRDFAIIVKEPASANNNSGKTVEAIMNGSHNGMLLPQKGEVVDKFIYGQTQGVQHNQAPRILLYPDMVGAILVMIRGVTQQDLDLRHKEQQRAEYEANILFAKDEAKWLKVDAFFNDDDQNRNNNNNNCNNSSSSSSTIIKDPNFVCQFLKRMGVSDEAQKHATLRVFGSDDGEGKDDGSPLNSTNKRISCFGKPVFPADVYCISAKLKNGDVAKKGDLVAGICVREYAVKYPIYLGVPPETMMNGGSSDKLTTAYYVEEGAKFAVLVRVPKLRADDNKNSKRVMERHLAKTILDQVNQQIGGIRIINPIEVDGDNVSASRKERTCEGCGVTWRKPMSRCQRCLSVRYCSVACQRGHWKDHKGMCQKPVSSLSSSSP